ncbi:MAG: PDZ domain-containing protein [Kangiellaceae bacterium]|nr:PDZ domain-containing protein [Kangiellaceae bacterium]
MTAYQNSFYLLIYRTLLTSFFGFMMTIFPTQAYNMTKESEAIIKNLELHIQSTLAAVNEAESKAGNNIQDLHILLEIPARHSPNLGLVLDLDSQENSYKVLSVTPGSLAESLNVSQGDLITSINNIKVVDDNKRSAFSQLENIVPGDTIKLTLTKDGNKSILNAIIKGSYIPSIKLEIGSTKLTNLDSSDKELSNDNKVDNENACGTVSVFFKPPETRRFYSAYINKIDDRSVVRSRETFRLKPGKHIIHVHEMISDPFFTRRSRRIQRAKPIEIDVKENTTYYLAAQFIPSKAFRENNGQYWKPIVWKTSTITKCEL